MRLRDISTVPSVSDNRRNENDIPSCVSRRIFCISCCLCACDRDGDAGDDDTSSSSCVRRPCDGDGSGCGGDGRGSCGGSWCARDGVRCDGGGSGRSFHVVRGRVLGGFLGGVSYCCDEDFLEEDNNKKRGNRFGCNNTKKE